MKRKRNTTDKEKVMTMNTNDKLLALYNWIASSGINNSCRNNENNSCSSEVDDFKTTYSDVTHVTVCVSSSPEKGYELRLSNQQQQQQLQHNNAYNNLDTTVQNVEKSTMVDEDDQLQQVQQQPTPKQLHVKLPLRFLLCRQTADEVLQKIFQEYENDEKWTEDECLALMLLYEKYGKKDQSFFYPYIALLPETYDTPLFWSDDELIELKGTNIYNLTNMMKQQIENDYYTIQLPVFEKYWYQLQFVETKNNSNNYDDDDNNTNTMNSTTTSAAVPSLDDYTWALSTIWSRAFGLNMIDTDSSENQQPQQQHLGTNVKHSYQHVLCPLIDLMNHDVTIRDPLDDFVSYCTKTKCLYYNIEKSIQHNTNRREQNENLHCDEQQQPQTLHISYGQYTNSKLLYSYGFVVYPTNPLRNIDFYINCPQTDPYYKVKQSLLEYYKLSSRYHTYDFTGTLFANTSTTCNDRLQQQPISNTLLGSLRIILMNETEIINNLTTSTTSLGTPVFLMDPIQTIISVRNELAVVTNLISVLNRKLQTYATSLDEDESILEQEQQLLMQSSTNESNYVQEEESKNDNNNTRRRKRYVMAVQVRIEDKIVLKRSIAWAEQYKATLTSTSS